MVHRDRLATSLRRLKIKPVAGRTQKGRQVARIVLAELKGVKELNININKLIREAGGPEVEKEIGRDALTLKVQLRARVRKLSGALADAIISGSKRRRTKTGNPEAFVAVDYKRLRKKLTKKQDKRKSLLGASFIQFIHNYGKYLEYGTSRMSAKPWWRPGVRAFKKFANTENALIRLFKRYGGK